MKSFISKCHRNIILCSYLYIYKLIYQSVGVLPFLPPSLPPFLSLWARSLAVGIRVGVIAHGAPRPPVLTTFTSLLSIWLGALWPQGGPSTSRSCLLSKASRGERKEKEGCAHQSCSPLKCFPETSSHSPDFIPLARTISNGLWNGRKKKPETNFLSRECGCFKHKWDSVNQQEEAEHWVSKALKVPLQ